MNAERLLRHYKQIADAPDAIARLRRFILDLAVRGKLVPQDPADEPASELLKRIAAEKARLVKAGKIRKPPALEPIAEAEEVHRLPATWAWVRVGDVFDYDAGLKRDPKDLDQSLWLLELEDIEKDTSRISAKEQRQASVYRLISRLTAEILSRDLPSDIETVTAEGVRFDFGDNEVVVNNKRGYSASSRTVIKNAFHLAILFASCLDTRMKYPKFLLLDNIEDKGMTLDRSQNFQRLVLEFSEEMEVEHQIIFTTSMPDEKLERPEYTVGRKYTEQAKSLNMA